MTTSEPLHVVTGAAGGIGLECARRIGRRGPLVLADREPEPLAAVADRLAADGRTIFDVNLLGTDALLRAFQPYATAGRRPARWPRPERH